MEALYKKLYDKYTKLKTKKMSDFDQLSKDQEVKFLNYVSAAEELIQHLKSENDRLRLQVNELSDEVASARSNMDAKCADYQKPLMEEHQRNNTLSEKVEKLQKLQQEGNFGGFNNVISNELHTPSGEVSKASSGGNTRKRSREAAPVTDELRTLHASAQDDPVLRQSTRELSQKAASSANMQLPECCGRNSEQSDGRVNDNVSTNCPYQCLVEHLMGMELSTTNRNEGICISAIHKSSGYSFSLTWINKLGGDTEILYRVISLGTFERVAPEWMKEVIMFSTSMCPTFLEKVTRVIKLHC
ncbi:uncharacterized protein LOC111020676 [Momordica charantia]|uniref:Uncharacterized protein LOC111020676 n=1 Tax=Momordica charantia TaxID=3673 RepID=A0A6J1DI04_MOMCH|nr:uncharacterized protein LOC111020676 [Momordica charantia]XP_022153093.1 uncharacterized protein LOC111020676 [Momordica charantia]